MKPIHLSPAPKKGTVSRDPSAALTPAVATLARIKTAAGAISYISADVPEFVYPALLNHMRARPAVFNEAVHAASVAYLEGDDVDRAAQALFAKAAPAMSAYARAFG